MIRPLLLALVLAAPAAGQEVANAPAALIRWLDKSTGQMGDLNLSRGQSATRGRLTVQLDECRYPVSDPASNAYAHLTIRDALVTDPVFSGWMIAASPALSALDHPRYDVWILRCEIE
jgi:hypothetical protein